MKKIKIHGSIGYIPAHDALKKDNRATNYMAVIVFPEMIFGGRAYKSSSIGITKGNSAYEEYYDIAFIGEFFDTMTLRESFIIREMLVTFVAGNLKNAQNFCKILSSFAFMDKEMKIREDFILLIKKLLMSIT